MVVAGNEIKMQKVANNKESENDGFCRIHNIRYYNLTPRAINNIACNKSSCKLALSRQDASIEIWDISDTPFLYKSILGLADSSIESLVWSNDRLFSCGLYGLVVEWDLTLLKSKKSIFLTGNAIWCLDIDKTNTSIAAGTEEGFLNIINIKDNEMNFQKTLDRQEGRILCCKFDYTGMFIVTGSSDFIRIWDINLGHVIHKMSTGRSNPTTETIVWALHVFKDFSIASGDSRGILSIWDGKLGARLDSNKISKADILSIGVNDEEDTLYCSGVDPTIKSFSYTSIRRDNITNQKWVKTLQRTMHSNDVKSLACYGKQLFSGGVDAYLIVSSVSPNRSTKYGPFLSKPVVTISEEKRITLFKYFNYLEIWKLGESLKDEILNDIETGKCLQTGVLHLEKMPGKLLELRSINDEPIINASISPNSKWLIYTTGTSIRIYQFQLNDYGPPILNRIKILPENFTPCSLILFTPDSKTILLSKNGGIIDVFKITENAIEFKQTIHVGEFLKDVVHLIVMSECGKYLVCAGTCNNISVWKINSKNCWTHYTNLPKYFLPPTSIAIRPNTSLLTAAYSDKKILEYNLDKLEITFVSMIEMTKNEILQIVFDPRNTDVIILYTDTSVELLNKKEKKRLSLIKKTKSFDDTTNVKSVLKQIKTYKHLIHLSWLSNNEMVAVEVNPVTLIAQLPPTLKKKTFGMS